MLRGYEMFKVNYLLRRSPGSLVEAAMFPRTLDGRAALENGAQEWRGRTPVLRRTVPLRAGTEGLDPGTANDQHPCGPERRCLTPVLRRTGAPARWNGGARQWYCEGPIAPAGRKRGVLGPNISIYIYIHIWVHDYLSPVAS